MVGVDVKEGCVLAAVIVVTVLLGVGITGALLIGIVIGLLSVALGGPRR